MSGTLIRAFLGPLYGGDIHPLSQNLFLYNCINPVPLLKPVPVAGDVQNFILVKGEQNLRVLEDVYGSIYEQLGAVQNTVLWQITGLE